MGARSRRKGAAYEREELRRLQDAGLTVERVFASGAAGGKEIGDLHFTKLGLRAECKRYRLNPCRRALKLMGDCDLLIARGDNEREPCVLMPLKLFIWFAQGAETTK